MKITSALFSSNSDNWGTPQKLFNELNKEFHFDIDVAASADNHKCEKFFSKSEDGLLQDWSVYNSVYCNPPYGKEIYKWVEKAANSNTLVVMLLPARTDTKYFHELIYNKHEIRFLKGRLKFNDGNGTAPFPSMIVIFRKEDKDSMKYRLNKTKVSSIYGDMKGDVIPISFLEKLRDYAQNEDAALMIDEIIAQWRNKNA